ncbi:MAG: alpha/beta fold hydrolase [Acidobacteria bacterium]|nr:alpha/beta fold hydrolase [Acidobacteriota bacterium]
MGALVYLHGFASGPAGSKASHCRAWAESRRLPFHAPDLNLPTFEELTLTAQVRAVERLLREFKDPPVVVGSSLGGLVGAAAAHRGCAIRQLILLAPAFGFAQRRMHSPEWTVYRECGEMEVFHHALGRTQCLGPALLGDLPHWADDGTWRLRVPTVVIHGKRDESVPLSESEAFAVRNPQAKLVIVDDDHALLSPATLAKLDSLLEGVWSQAPSPTGGPGLHRPRRPSPG